MKELRILRNVWVICGLFIFGMTSCIWETIEPVEVNLPDTVSFSQDIIPIFEAKCVSCHDTGGIAPDLTSANAYNALISGGYVDTNNPEGSFLYEKIIPGGSMENYAGAQDRAAILKWIQEGALNN